MEEITSLADLWRQVHVFENNEFLGRYLPFEKVEKGLLELPSIFQIEEQGKSVGGKKIYSVQFGSGKTKILMWSQMHGNETTTTKAILDLFQSFSKVGNQSFFQEITTNCTILIIPILNPDGAIAYSRENKNKVDLNRDAVDLSQPESQILQTVFKNFNPDFCFNLHDQRSIYAAGNTENPAIVSFLAPSANEGKSIDKTRKTAMKLIVEINDFLQNHIPGCVGRYDDSFNPNCVGDKFQSLKVPTLLFEAGHFPRDYRRNKTRNLIFMALFAALRSISTKTYECQDVEDYFSIPENEKSFFDILLRNLSINGNIADISIQYEERLVHGKIEFVPIVEKIGDLSYYYGHKNRGFNGEKLQINQHMNIQEKNEINHIYIGKKQFLIDLTNN